MKKELELYIHIPFCVKKCEYCDFLSGPAGRETQKEYVKALCDEIKAVNVEKEYEVSTIFIGGGTPSVLPAEWILQILDTVKETFVIQENAEISMEANPGTVTAESLEIYRKAGINRLSFGCQSTENEELKLLGRIHTWEDFLESFCLARNAGFTNINVDLMSGLPGQSLEAWENGLKKVAALEPEHISAYSLIIEEGTPFGEKDLDLPEEECERKMYERTHEILETFGYHQYEISNYAKKGKECRHNIGYWKRVEYLGLGLGSASLMKETRFSNETKMDIYLKESKYSEKIRHQIEKLSREDQMGEMMILGLRMTNGVSLLEFLQQFGCSMEDVYGKVIEKYQTLGLLEIVNEHLRFTREGISVSNPILADFLF